MTLDFRMMVQKYIFFEIRNGQPVAQIQMFGEAALLCK
jgi:hypothetical protein